MKDNAQRILGLWGWGAIQTSFTSSVLSVILDSN
jgi:hypothetical protein